MEKLDLELNIDLDSVVDLLIEKRNNNCHVYVEFNGVNLYSDTITYDSAYLDVCGCTKK